MRIIFRPQHFPQLFPIIRRQDARRFHLRQHTLYILSNDVFIRLNRRRCSAVKSQTTQNHVFPTVCAILDFHRIIRKTSQGFHIYRIRCQRCRMTFNSERPVLMDKSLIPMSACFKELIRVLAERLRFRQVFPECLICPQQIIRCEI